MNKIVVFAAIGFMLLFTACQKYNTNFNTLPESTTDWLLPLAKGKVSFENLKALNNVKTTFNVPSVDIGYASGIPVNVPPITIPEVGPYKQALSNWIHTIQFDTLQLDLAFSNVFPITINAGTKISLRRSPGTANPANLIYEHSISNDILPGQAYTFQIDVVNNSMSDTIYLYLEQFSSPGGNNVTFSTSPSKIELTVKIIDVKKVEMHPNKSVTESDTLDIEFGEDGNDSGDLDTSSYATVHLFVDHALPINFFTQIYFLDPLSSVVTDSLFDNPLNLIGIQTNMDGNPLSVNATKHSVFISPSRINHIKKSSRAVIQFRMNTNGYPGPYVNLSDQTYLQIQLTGDLHLRFNLNSL